MAACISFERPALLNQRREVPSPVPGFLNARGEAPACSCCGRAWNWVAFVCGGLSFLAFVFALGATYSQYWTTFTLDSGGEQDFFVGLYVLYRHGDDDDTSRINGNDDLLIHWRTFQLNRAATLLTLSLAFFASIFYVVSACCGRCKCVEVLFGTVFVLFSLLSLSASALWVDNFDDKYFFDDQAENVEDKVICGPGCALQFLTATYCLFLGIGMLLFASLNCFCFPDDRLYSQKDTDLENPN